MLQESTEIYERQEKSVYTGERTPGVQPRAFAPLFLRVLNFQRVNVFPAIITQVQGKSYRTLLYFRASKKFESTSEENFHRFEIAICELEKS